MGSLSHELVCGEGRALENQHRTGPIEPSPQEIDQWHFRATSAVRDPIDAKFSGATSSSPI